MTNDERRAALATIVKAHTLHEGSNETIIDAVRCLKFSVANAKVPDIYDPSICIIVQGRKETLLEGEIYQYSPAQFLAVSVALPLIAHVIEASPERPYLCLQILIDQAQMSELIIQTRAPAPDQRPTGRGIFVGQVNDVMLDAVFRLANLLNAPKDAATLGPLVLREIYYRILNGEYGPAIARLAVPGSSVQRIAKVIEHLREDITQPIRIQALADFASMSVSSFHDHFKAVTAMSPLQYYKRLRLTEARQIMLAEDADATSTAYRVGYESLSQFSREYARMFGAPPRTDVERVKRAAQANV